MVHLEPHQPARCWNCTDRTLGGRYPQLTLLLGTPAPERNDRASAEEPHFDRFMRLLYILFSMTLVTDLQFIAILGDLHHKRNIYSKYTRFGPVIDQFFDSRHQAAWLRDYYPSRVPADNPGTGPPSDHRVSTYFEYFYEVDPMLRAKYLGTLVDHPVLGGDLYTRPFVAAAYEYSD